MTFWCLSGWVAVEEMSSSFVQGIPHMYYGRRPAEPAWTLQAQSRGDIASSTCNMAIASTVHSSAHIVQGEDKELQGNRSVAPGLLHTMGWLMGRWDQRFHHADVARFGEPGCSLGVCDFWCLPSG